MSSQLEINFIGIGARKSGTTWIAKCLSEHPEIDFAKDKETNFFLSDSFILEMKNDPVLGDPVRFIKCNSIKELENQFKNSSENAKGEYSPYYLYDKNAGLKIKEMYPNAKLIVILRNPIEAIYSNYWFDKSAGQKGFPSTFEEALKMFPHYMDWMLYSKLLKPYLEYFKPEQLLVLLHDDLKADPGGVIKSIYSFLGVDNSFEPPSLNSKVNKAKDVRFQTIANFSRQIARFLIALKLRWIIDKGFGVYSRINKKSVSYPEMSPETKAFLYEKFIDDINDLEKLIDRDLSNWKK